MVRVVRLVHRAESVHDLPTPLLCGYVEDGLFWLWHGQNVRVAPREDGLKVLDQLGRDEWEISDAHGWAPIRHPRPSSSLRSPAGVLAVRLAFGM